MLVRLRSVAAASPWSPLAFVAVLSSFFHNTLAVADDKAAPHQHELEEVLVSAPDMRQRGEISQSTSVLSGDALLAAGAATLGDTLQSTPGISSASFGPGVGSPVIRGQSGNRVKVLSNNAGTADASAVSPDHANAVEPLLAEKIEIIRGPATLLYGNGAIGGVVNIIDNRIPTRRADETTGAIEQRHDTNSDQNTSVAKVDTGAGDWALHVDGVYRERNDVRIDGEAIRETQPHDEEEEEREEEHASGYIPNTGALSKSLTIGNSWITDSGYAGIAVNRLENRYGIPPGAHHHEVGEEEQDEGEENLQIDMKQTRVDAKTGWTLAQSFWKNLEVQLGYSDYEHREIENGATGTRFTNDALETRVEAAHRFNDAWHGVVGFQGSSREFAAVGDEAFIPETDGNTAGIFTVQTYRQGAWTFDAGLRAERSRLSPDGNCSRNDSSVSASTGSVWRFLRATDMTMSVSHSQRSPSIEEYYSNVDTQGCVAKNEGQQPVAHVASQRIEIGNPDLDNETANNIEWGMRQRRGRFTGSFSLFYNDVHDFIYLADSDTLVDDTQVAFYRQQAAVFKGAEFEITWHSSVNDIEHWELGLFGDAVRAEFDDGEWVPRTPPQRLGAEVGFVSVMWSARLRWTEAADQDRVFVNETETEGYSLVTLYADYHMPLAEQELTLFIKGNNLLDEEIRQSSSFIKDVAPDAGRGVEGGIRYLF
jgi:iron complex outermembrane receptor protein